MKKDLRSLVWGIIFILVGLLFLGNNLHWWSLRWQEIWPLLMIAAGIVLFFGWLANRKEVGILMPATILVMYGAMFEYSAVNGWYWMDHLWPIFILAPGVGFFLMYFAGGREQSMAVAGTVLTAVAFAFWAGKEVSRYFWPMVLILIGLYLLYSANQKKQNPHPGTGEASSSEEKSLPTQPDEKSGAQEGEAT